MAVRVRCPNPDCGKTYRVDESQLGRKTVCRRCGQPFTLTASDRETLAPAGEADTTDSASPRPAQQAAGGIPKKLGRFEIRSRLGAGAFGTVYRAHDPMLDREVALKVPRAAVLQKPEVRARFLREPKAAAQLQHPHIVPVFDAGTDGEHYYIASAFIEGRTLEDAIAEERPDFRRAAQIVRDLAGALDYAHRAGVVHRDVKPANVMIDQRGEPMLMDFGLARLEASEEKLTQDGSIMGTPAYMAPEQADGSLGEVGPASDQYALGVVLYELLCGATPFSGPPAVVLYNILHEEPPRPRTANARIPRDLETICLKAMSKRRAERYADCGALAEDLRRYLADEPIQARRTGPVERLARWARRNRALSFLAAASAVLLVAVAVVTTVSAIRTGRALSRETAARQEADRHRVRAEEAQQKETSAREGAEEALAREKAANRRAEKANREAQEAQKQEEVALAKASSVEQRAENVARRADNLAREVDGWKEQASAHYQSGMAMAWEKWRAGDLDGARQLLNDCPPEVRQWEWRFLGGLVSCRVVAQRGGTGRFNPAFRPHSANRSPRIAGRRRSQVVHDAIFTPDGAHVISQGRSGSIAVWEAVGASGAKTFSVPPPHEYMGKSLAVGPDGKLLAILGDRADRRARPRTPLSTATMGHLKSASLSRTTLWDLVSGKAVMSCDGHVRHLDGAVFSPDGKYVAIGSDDKSVAVYETGSQKTAKKIKVGAKVLNAAFHSSGAYLATNSDEGVAVWDWASGERLFAETARVARVRFAGNARLVGRAIRSPSDDHLWTITHRTLVEQRLPRQMGSPFVVDPLGHHAASATADGKIDVLAVEDWRVIRTLEGDREPVSDITFGPDGRFLAASTEKSVTIWDVATGELVDSISRELQGESPNRVVFGPNHGAIAVICGETVSVFPLWRQGALANTIDLHPADLAFSPDGREIALAWRDRVVVVATRDVVSPVAAQYASQLPRLPGSPAHLPAGVSEAADSETPGSQPEAQVRGELAHGLPAQDVFSLPEWTTEADRIAFSREGPMLFSPSSEGRVRIWDVARQKELAEFFPKKPPVRAMAATAGLAGIHVAVLDADGKLEVWWVTEGPAASTTLPLPTELSLPGLQGEEAQNFAFAGERLLLVNLGDALYVWEGPEVQFGKPSRLAGDWRNISAVTRSPDGQRIVSGGSDGSVCLWDAGTGAKLLELGTFVEPSLDDLPGLAEQETREAKAVRTVCFSPDRNTIAVLWERGVTIWQAPVFGPMLQPLRSTGGLLKSPTPRLGTGAPSP